MTNGSGITPTSQNPSIIAKDGGQVVQIKTLPDALQSVSRAVRLEGEVIAQNKDGTTRIQTPQGPVDITVRGKQPQVGQRVELDLPTGNPPKTATLRVTNAPPAPPQPQQPSSPPPIQTGSPPPSPLPSTQPPVRPNPTPAAPPPVTLQPVVTPPPSGALPSAPVDLDGITKQLTQPPLPSLKPSPLPLSIQQTPTTPAQPSPRLPAPLMMGQTVRISPLPAGSPAPIPSPAAIPVAQTVLTPSIPVLFPSLMRLTSAPSMAVFVTRTSIQTMPDLLLNNMATPTPMTGAPKTITFTFFSSPPSAPQLSQGQPPTPPSSLSLWSLITMPPDSAIAPLSRITPQSFTKPPLILDAKIISLQTSFATITDGIEPSFTQTPFISKPMTGAMITLPLKAGQMPAIVTGFTPGMIPVLSMGTSGTTGSILASLQFPVTNISDGTHIIFAPTSNTPVLAQGFKPIIALTQALPFWPVMDDALQSLGQLDPALAQIFSKTIPNPSMTTRGSMGAAALLFIAAIRAGDLQGWMGDKRLEALQRGGKGDLLSRLSSDTNSATQRTSDGAGGEWRSYPMPLLWQNEIAKVMLHIHHDAPTQEKTDQNGATRFILDLSLTHMGDVQIDCLLRGGRLDLILRTEKQISYPMQQAMKTAYAGALEDTRIYGDIAFQSDIKTWVQVIRSEESLGVSA